MATTVLKGRKYVCTFSCGKASAPGSRVADQTEFTEGQIYPCVEEGFLTNNFGEKRRISERSLKLFFKQYRRLREPKLMNEGLFNDDEMTRYGFISHMEDFIKQLLKDPTKAKTDDYLVRHGIDSPKAVKLLVMKSDPNDENSAILLRKERIEDGGYNENGKRLKDKFHIKYTLPRKDYDKKMKKLYIRLFENHQCDNPMLNEEDGGAAIGDVMGSTNTFNDGSGQFVQPLFGKPIKKDLYKPKTLQITEEQLNAIKEATTTFGMTPQNNAMGDMTPPGCFNDAETNDHKNMMKKSAEEYKWNVNEEGIHIKEKNKGKFNATKKRTGKSTSELLHSPNKKTRARANFARMAKRGWKPLKKD